MINEGQKKLTEDNPPDLGIEVQEEVGVGESIGQWKLWFNGRKFFHTVKLLPRKG